MKKNIIPVLCGMNIILDVPIIALSASCINITRISDTLNNELKKIENTSLIIPSQITNNKTVDEFLTEIKKKDNSINQEILFKYIQEPQLDGNTKLVIKNITISEKSNKYKDSSICLNAEFYLTKGKYKSKYSFLNIFGTFCSLNIKDQMDVNHRANNLEGQMALSTDSSAKLVAPCFINRYNVSQYINGLPNDLVDYKKIPDNSQLKTEIYSISPDEDNNQSIQIKFIVTKNKAKSNIIVRTVYGFKEPSAADQEAIKTEEAKITNLTIKNNENNNFPKNILASQITKENINNYINMPTLGENVFLNVIELKPDDNLGTLMILMQISKNEAISRIFKKTVSGFNILKKNELKKLEQITNDFDLQIKEAGKTVLASKVTTENITQYVTNFPLNENNIESRVSSVSCNNDLGILFVELEIKRDSILVKKITKNVVGFKTTNQQNKINVYETYKSLEKLTIKDDKKTSLPSSLISEIKSNNNIETYFNNWTKDENNTIKRELLDIFADDDSGCLILKQKITKENASCEVVETVSGFKTSYQKDKEEVDAEYNRQNSNSEIKINEKGRQILAYNVNVENCEQYISGISHPSPNLTLEFIHAGIKNNNDSSISVSYRIRKNNAVSEVITKEISGFKSISEENKNKINSKSESELNWKINTEGIKTKISSINLDNIHLFIEGYKNKLDNDDILIKIVDFRIKTNDTTNTTIVLGVEFSNNDAYKIVEKEISGFLPLTDEEVLLNEIKKTKHKINTKGQEISSSNLNKDNIKNYIEWNEVFNNHWNNIDWTETEFNPIKDETALEINFVFVKNGKKINLKQKIEGFLNKTSYTDKQLFLLAKKYENIEMKNNINDIFKIFNKEEKIKKLDEFFILPSEEKNISIDYEFQKICEIDGTNSLLVNWILTNKLNNKKISIKNKFLNIWDPFYNFKKMQKTIQQIVVTKNKTEQENPLKYIIAGTEQNLFTNKWETEILHKYKTKHENWNVWVIQWLDWKLNELKFENHKYNYTIKTNENLQTIRFFDYKINDKESIPVIGCLNKFTIEFTIENEQKIEFEFYVEFLLKNNYWDI